MAIHLHLLIFTTFTVLTYAQQPYIDNKQLNCTNNFPFTKGFQCNTLTSTPSCLSYATFRTTSVYDTANAVGGLLAASPEKISLLNNLSSPETSLRPDTLLLVPLSNCSCVDYATGGSKISDSTFYQHAASYTIKIHSETYFTIANLTFQGLSTCQALITRNTMDPLDLFVGDNISVPMRCACPSRNQTSLGFRFLLSYIITWGDSIGAISYMFGADIKSVLDANELSEDSIIYPFTPLLVPLRSEPVIKASLVPSPDPSSPNVPSVAVDGKNSNNSSRKRLFLFIGLGIGVTVLFLFAVFVFVYCLYHNKRTLSKPEGSVIPPQGISGNSFSVSSETVRFAIGSLSVYNFEDLVKATGFFDRRIKGSVYLGSFKGDEAAVKIVRGDVSEEISILKKINHSNIIRLSGFCVHDRNTYLVYEYALNGSLDEWLGSKEASKEPDILRVLGWKQRVQIAYDVADALNYLHNYTNPPYVHKNLKSSNILLDSAFRAKVSNFGLARSLGEDSQMTRHVVGTHGYMAPEYIENGLITPKIDVFSLGVVLLEILSGKEAASKEELLSVTICEVLEGENVRGKLEGFLDPCLEGEYPLDLAFSLAKLAEKCVATDLNSRPSMAEVFMTLSKILSSSMDWDPSEELNDNSRSLSRGR